MIPRRRALALAAVLCLAAGVRPLLAQSPSNFAYNGVVHVSWWWNEYNNFDQPTGPATDSRNVLATTRANWAGLLVTQYQDNISSNVIGFVLATAFRFLMYRYWVYGNHRKGAIRYEESQDREPAEAQVTVD